MRDAIERRKGARGTYLSRHSTPPSGTETVHSTSPSGAKADKTAVGEQIISTRRHRVAQRRCTRRHRVARPAEDSRQPDPKSCYCGGIEVQAHYWDVK